VKLFLTARKMFCVVDGVAPGAADGDDLPGLDVLESCHGLLNPCVFWSRLCGGGC
jgi:hypothetical protein